MDVTEQEEHKRTQLSREANAHVGWYMYPEPRSVSEIE